MRIICQATYHPYESVYDGSIRSAERARAHFRERGVDAQFFYGIDKRLGVVATFLKGSGQPLAPRSVACWLSLRALWAACLLLPDDRFLLLQDDAFFPVDWRSRLDDALRHAGDFDMLYVGSCWTDEKPSRHIGGSVYEVKWPVCLHACIISGHKVLERLIDVQDKIGCREQMDDSLFYHSLPHMKVYTVLPRIVEQVDRMDRLGV